MSEPRLISPLLDDFAMGAPMSEHHGVRCCPAMEKDSDNKYIVKIISIPASQTQLDALLLAGAYPNSAAALDYFRELASGVEKEALALERLSRMEGFLPYTRWQIVPMEQEVGFDVYLISPYRHSLQRFFRKETMTHLGAVNLGLDLCAAMAVCRHAGLLYVDLKPGNIFLSDDQEYRVGDLGFVPLRDLKCTSLPDKYRSAYTPPEIQDAFSTLNTTVDIYAIGLILYQAYNGGVLPFQDRAPAEALPAPQYADYELAEIILKACAPDPADRWQDPIAMGQALVSYMQRNGVNDTPIVPPAVIPEEAPPVPEEAPEEVPEAASEEAPSSQSEEEPLAFLTSELTDETAPGEETVDSTEYHELSNETSDILAQADELIAMEMPEPVIAPAPAEVPVAPEVPAPVEPSEEPPAEAEGDVPPASEEAAPAETDETSAAPEEPEAPEVPLEPEKPKKSLLDRILVPLVLILLAAVLAFGGYFFYSHYYLIPIDSLMLEGVEDQLTVRVSTKGDEALLKVLCTDTYGNVLTQSLVGGEAHFQELKPNTQYSVTLEVAGFHGLTGSVSENYHTPDQTDILQFSAQAGADDGSVILNFTVDGKEPSQWKILYSTPGEEEQSVTFTGHTVTVSGLSLNKEYTFLLTCEEPLHLEGTVQLTYTASALIYAENLAITACADGSLTAVWAAPENYPVESWTVRCYNDADYDQSMVTSELQATFTDLDTTKGYTVEVTAEGMTMGTHTYITPNSVTILSNAEDTADPTQLKVSWTFSGPAPENGWLLLYTIDDTERQEVITCSNNSAVISPMIPGSVYHFTLQTATGATVFNSSFSAETPQAPNFRGYDLATGDFDFILCHQPDKEDWSYTDVTSDMVTSDFQVGDKAALILRVHKTYNYDWQEITTMFLIRDENGAFVSADLSSNAWALMWGHSRCELDIPNLPGVPGNYTLLLYFGGAYVGETTFTVSPGPEE